MEPLDDGELKRILQRWQAPAAPGKLFLKIQPGRRSWWRWILTGTIRVPVPVGIALALAAAVFFFLRTSDQPVVEQPVKSVSLADFQPVKQLEPRIIGRANESN